MASSALEIVVQHELHVLNQIPIFEQLIEAKWRAFARWHHLAFAVAPYLFFFTCFNAGACSSPPAACLPKDSPLPAFPVAACPLPARPLLPRSE